MDQIEELLTRGVANIIPSREELQKVLRSDKKLNVYLGIDPTSVHIHLGHATHLRRLQKLADLGHHVTFLIGDFTALVGDTSDKDSERPILTPNQIEANWQTYKNQAEKIIDFSKVTVRRNSEWLDKLSAREILNLMSQFSLNDFNSRELIKKRLSLQIVRQLHGAAAADSAQSYFESTFQQGQTPADIPEVKVQNTNIIDALVESGLARSKSEARRLIEQGGVQVNNQKVTAISYQLPAASSIVRVGRKFAKVTPK